MDSRPIGSDELIYIQAGNISITVKGKIPPASPDGAGAEDASSLRVQCRDEVAALRVGGGEVDRKQQAFSCAPLFFEQHAYEIIIENMGSGEVSFWHENLSVRRAVTPVGSRGTLLSGIVNFRNNIGFSDFIICLNGKEYIKLTIEVFPEKISYRKDYREIMADVAEELYAIIFDFLRKTYYGYGQSRNRGESPVEFYAVVTTIFKRFLRALDKIISEPHHTLENRHEIVPGYKAVSLDRCSISWLAHHPEHITKKQGRILVDKTMAAVKKVSYDTRENRMTRYILESTIRRLQTFRQMYGLMAREKDGAVFTGIDSMVQSLRCRETGTFLQAVESQGSEAGLSLVFALAPGYRELYKYYLMLERGLNITGDVFHASVKDLAVLYEYWCFIKLNSMLRKKYELVSQDVIRVEGNRLFVTLLKGKGSEVRYRNSYSGERIVLSYNPRETGLPTVPQRPYNVLTLTKDGMEDGSLTYRYIFDAKYKIDPAVEGSYYYNVISHTPGPREEDINTMHRYRDAIVSENGARDYERTMFGAYVLFPYADEETYRKHKFYKSIETVNIGGLPFLPSATGMVEQMLDELVADSPESAFERTVLPLGIERKLARVDWGQRDVLVGVLKNVKQLQICQKYHFYHIPASKIPEKRLPIHYVAIYQSRRLFGEDSGIFLYGEVIRTALVRRRSIREIPKDSDELYYRFAVRKWNRLPHPVKVRESARIADYTNLFLLQHADEMPDLKIRSEEEYRLYYELRRLSKGALTNDPEKPLCFRHGKFLMDYEDSNIRILYDGKIRDLIPAEQFIRHPYWYFKKLMQYLQVAQDT